MPVSKGGPPMLQINLQSLCKPHHVAKTAEQSEIVIVGHAESLQGAIRPNDSDQACIRPCYS